MSIWYLIYIWEEFMSLHFVSKRYHFFLNFGALFETLLNWSHKNRNVPQFGICEQSKNMLLVGLNQASQYTTLCPWPPGGPWNLIESYQWHIFTLLTISELGNISVLMWSVQKCLKQSFKVQEKVTRHNNIEVVWTFSCLVFEPQHQTVPSLIHKPPSVKYWTH